MRRPRSDGVILLHGPSSNAERAARTARLMSSAPPSAMRARVSPVAGFGVSNVLPDAASVHCPLMNNWRGVAMKASVFLSRVTVIGIYLLALEGRGSQCPARLVGACSPRSGRETAPQASTHNLTANDW